MNCFCFYVLCYIILVVCDRVILENVEFVGFLQFSKVFYIQNVLEFGNVMLKNWIGFKESDVDFFILDLKEMVMREEDDVVRVFVGLELFYEVLEEFCFFVFKSVDYLINFDLFEQERKRRKVKMLNVDFFDVLSKVDKF